MTEVAAGKNGASSDARETGVRRADFEQINVLLERVEGEVKTEFTTGVIGAIDAVAGLPR